MENTIKPYEEVKEILGAASPSWEKLLSYIRYHYAMDEKWVEGKPTNKTYHNLFIRRSGKSLIMFAIREGYFQTCIVLGKDERERFEAHREQFGEAICKEYDAAQTYHDGKWLAFDISDETLLDDIISLLHLKRKPNRKVFPDSLEECGRLDLGMSHEEITKQLIP